MGKPQCPKCFGKMDDGFTFMDTEAGRKMKEAMEIAKLKQRKLETLQRKVHRGSRICDLFFVRATCWRGKIFLRI